MNLADMMTLITFFGCPVAIEVGAFSGRAGWFTLLFIALGIIVSFGCSCCVRSLAYFLLFAAGKQSKNWLCALWLFGYLFAPMIAAFGFIILTGGLSAWLARLLF